MERATVINNQIPSMYDSIPLLLLSLNVMFNENYQLI